MLSNSMMIQRTLKILLLIDIFNIVKNKRILKHILHRDPHKTIEYPTLQSYNKKKLMNNKLIHALMINIKFNPKDSKKNHILIMMNFNNSVIINY